jgi:hypothetical protein
VQAEHDISEQLIRRSVVHSEGPESCSTIHFFGKVDAYPTPRSGGDGSPNRFANIFQPKEHGQNADCPGD